MKFGDYLKNRDPQFAEGLTEGWFGGGGLTLDPQQKKAIYQVARNEIDQLAKSKGMDASRAVDEFAQNLYNQPVVKQKVNKLMQDVAAMGTGEKLTLPGALARFVQEGGMRELNLAKHLGAGTTRDLRAAPNLGPEGPITPLRNQAQRNRGYLPGQ